MKHRILTGLLAISLLAVCSAQAATTHPATASTKATNAASATTAPAASTAPAPAKHFIWRASKGHDHIYLVGSIHTLNPNDYPLPDVMENNFVDSYALVEETDLTILDPDTVQQEAQRIGTYPDGESLQKNLPPGLYQEVSGAALTLGLDMQQLDRLHPWFASVVILNAQLRRADFKASDGVDHHFADEAQIMEKPVIGLETPRFQLELMAGLPKEAQMALLQNAVTETANFESNVHALITAWRNGDAAGLNAIMQQDFAHSPIAYRRLIVERNNTWFPRLERLAQDGHSYFVVIGAAHLVGPDGLLARFRKAGYEVEQL